MVDRIRNLGRDGGRGDDRDGQEHDARAWPPHPIRKAAVWARVQLARNLRRPRILALLAEMADELIELHGDRLFGDDEAIVAGLATIDGHRVAVVGQQKGADTEENVRRNFGMPHPEGYRKAMRVMELAERSGLPVVTFVDVPGAHPGPESEERGIAEAIARSVGLMTRLRTPIVTVITGEGGSGGAIAIAVGDVVLALENAVYSVISPEGCASILWRTSDEASTAALAMRMTAADQLKLGVVDEVIPEPPDGAQADPVETARRLRAAIVRELDRLATIPIDLLVDARYRRYRALGAFTELPGATPTPPIASRPGLADRLRSLLEAGQRAIPAPLPVGRRDEPPAREDASPCPIARLPETAHRKTEPRLSARRIMPAWRCCRIRWCRPSWTSWRRAGWASSRFARAAGGSGFDARSVRGLHSDGGPSAVDRCRASIMRPVPAGRVCRQERPGRADSPRSPGTRREAANPGRGGSAAIRGHLAHGRRVPA